MSSVAEELVVDDSEVIDATVGTETDGLTTSFLQGYSITLVKDGTDGDPMVEVQGSNDGLTWVNPYLDEDELPLIIPLDELTNSIRDTALWMFRDIRVKTIPNGTTTGTLKYSIHYRE